MSMNLHDPKAQFIVYWTGNLPRERVRISWDNLPLLFADQRRMDQQWLDAVSKAKERGTFLFNGKLARLVSYSVNEDLHLVLGSTNYADFYVCLGSPQCPQALGVSALVVTSDDKVILGRRSEKVAIHPKCLHCVGGMTETDGQGADPWKSMMQELKEELNLSEYSMKLIGLVRDSELNQPEAIFAVWCTQTASELKQMSARAIDSSEHCELVELLPSDSLIDAICGQLSEFTPVARAAILCYGKQEYGEKWTDDYMRKLAD